MALVMSDFLDRLPNVSSIFHPLLERFQQRPAALVPNLASLPRAIWLQRCGWEGALARRARRTKGEQQGHRHRAATLRTLRPTIACKFLWVNRTTPEWRG